MTFGRGYTSGCVGASGHFFVMGGSHFMTCPPGIECYDFVAQKWRIFGHNLTQHQHVVTAVPVLAAPLHTDVLNDNNNNDNNNDEGEDDGDHIFHDGEDGDVEGGDGGAAFVDNAAALVDGILGDYLMRASHQVQYLL
jgi:hypothetical protein